MRGGVRFRKRDSTARQAAANCKFIASFDQSARYKGLGDAENCFHTGEQGDERRTHTRSRRGSARRKLREKGGYNSILGPNVVTPSPKRTPR